MFRHLFISNNLQIHQSKQKCIHIDPILGHACSHPASIYSNGNNTIYIHITSCFIFSVTAFNKVHENQLHHSACPATHSLFLLCSFTRTRSHNAHYLTLLPSYFCSMHITFFHSFSNTSLHVALKITFYTPSMTRLHTL